jgi:uncharacterized protein (TIGR02646 family)
VRRIRKQKEPECLAAARRDLRSTGPASPDDWATLATACKEQVRRSLATEQLGLCAYCTRRLDASRGARDDQPRDGGMRIEHWAARSVEPSRTLDWSNLLGACGGILEGSPVGIEHVCDKARGDRALELNPAHRDVDVQALFRYTAQGEIRSEDPRARRDIETLNLQAATLRAQRSELWRRQGEALRRDDSVATLRRMLHSACTPGRDGRLPPFAPLVEYYAARKLRQRRVKT